jgi:hypothetical protein
MSYRDKLKQSQGTEKNFIKLDILHRIEVKAIKTTRQIEDPQTKEMVDVVKKTPTFQYYDPTKKDDESKGYVKFQQNIEGILIGSAMQLSIYSKNLNASYFSDYFISKNNVIVFDPSKKKAFQGTLDGAKSWFAANTDGKPTNRKVLFVLTKKGLFAITTNLTIAIDQLNSAGTSFQSKYIVLSAAIYKHDSKTISKKAKEFLGAVVSENPPNYCEISVGKEFTDDEAKAMDIEKHIDLFEIWKKSKESNPTTSEPITTSDVRELGDLPSELEVTDPSFNEQPTASDDLPF